jgi:hypothetical protein
VESGDRWLGKSESGMWKVDTFKVVAPCLCRLKTDCWPPRASIERIDHILVYGPSKSSSLSSIEAWLKSTTLLVDLGEKLGTDARIDQPTWCGLYRESFFSGAVESVEIYRRLVNGCYTWTT